MIYVTEESAAYSLKPWMAGAFAADGVMYGSWGNPSDSMFLAAAGVVVVVMDLMESISAAKGAMKFVGIAVCLVLSVTHVILSWIGGEYGGVHNGGQALFGLTLGLGLGLILHGVAREPLTKAGDEGKGRAVMVAAVLGLVTFLVILITFFIITGSDDVKHAMNALYGSLAFGVTKYTVLFGTDPIEGVDTLFADNLAWAGLLIAPTGAALGLMIGGKIGKNDGKPKSSMAPLWHLIRFVLLVVLMLPITIWMMYGRYFADAYVRTFLGIMLPELCGCVIMFGLFIPICKLLKLVE